MEQGGDMPGVSMHDLREDVGIDVAECVRQGVDESVAVITLRETVIWSFQTKKSRTRLVASNRATLRLWPGGAARCHRGQECPGSVPWRARRHRHVNVGLGLAQLTSDVRGLVDA